MRLAFTPLAEQDLEAIADYIAADNPTRALSFVRELRAQCQRIMFASCTAGGIPTRSVGMIKDPGKTKETLSLQILRG